MKQALVILILITTCGICNSQTYNSIVLTGEDYVIHGGLTQFNDRTIIAASELCNGFFGVDCTYLLEVQDDDILYLRDVGELKFYDKSITSNQDRLTIVGIDVDSKLKLIQFDTLLNVLNTIEYDIGDVGNSWIFGIVEFAGNYVVSEYRYGTNGVNYPSLYWFDCEDLSYKGSYTIEENNATLKELTIDKNKNLAVLKSKNGNHEILTFDPTMELIDTLVMQESGPISYSNFDITSDGSILFGPHQQRKLLCYTSQGQFNWELDIAAGFGVSKVILRETKVVSNGDILLCGSLEKADIDYGFMYLLDSDGGEKWKRIYRTEMATHTTPLYGIVELVDEGFVFYGSVRFEPFPSSNNFRDTHWVLKTDYDGCIDVGCGSDLILSTNEINYSDPLIFPNPADFNIEISDQIVGSNQYYIITNSRGQKVDKGVLQDNQIEISGLASGAYFLSVYHSDKLLYTKQFVKN